MGNEYIDRFFEKMDHEFLALSFGDVRLKTAHSDVLPIHTDTRSKFSRNIPVRIPIISSPMDTVTESVMAIAMAKAGGLGIIHRGRDFTPEEQAKEVTRVKLHMNGLIANPICVPIAQSVRATLELRSNKGWSFHSFPVTNEHGNVVGIVTENDFAFCDNQSLTIGDIMTRDAVTAPQGTDLEAAYQKMLSHKKKALPLVNSEGKIAGMYVLSDVKRVKTGNMEGFNLDTKGQLRVGAAIGTGEKELERAECLFRAGVDVIVIDTAHGDTATVIDGTLKPLKERFPAGLDIVVGNVSEGESAKRLVDAGADGIRVGQGPGSICTTRMIAGVGCPQVTAIYNCAKAVRGSGIPVCADGGITVSGDITIALVVGADTVMLGRLLAGSDESPGKETFVGGAKYKTYRGMGSLGAMQESQASRQRYGQPSSGKDSLVPEGVEGLVPSQGPVSKLLQQYVGGLQSGMGYNGAATIAELKRRGKLYRITPVGLAESRPHDIHYMKEAPNFKA